MKKLSVMVASLLLAMAHAGAAAPATTQVCWLETAFSDMDGAMGGAGLQHTGTWHSTVSAILIRHPQGDILVDTGFGPRAEAQMDELPAPARAFGLQVVGGANDRTPIVALLGRVGEPPAQVARILVTHAHYDHLGGATQLSAPVYVSAREVQWMAEQAAHPTITPPSLVAAVKPRLQPLGYKSGPYLGFAASADVYGDGAVVAVPLPGHTPGSQGVLVTVGRQRMFLVGDATDTVEAAERGLPKSAAIRANTDFDPASADLQAQRLAAFHRAYPETALIPAHDRTAYAAVFGAPSACITGSTTSLPAAAGAPSPQPE